MIAAAMIASMLWSPDAGKRHVDAFRCGTATEFTSAPADSINRAYIERSVAIVHGALAKDLMNLSSVVAPKATAVFFHYDNGVASPGTGPRAIIGLLGSIKPRHYEFFEPRGFPVPAVKPCGLITIRLILKRAQASKAFLATFNYERGLLIELTVTDADYSAGKID